MNYAVTIIVPVYGVEQYLEQCVVSLFEQDFENIEYIFVNDCTPDNSIAILEQVIEKYPNRKPHIKIIHHEHNMGSGATRKTGILNATGEYTIQIDSDDWCELDMISSLYRKAKEDNADMVVCDFYEEKLGRVKYVYTFFNENLFGLLLSGRAFASLWNKLIKRSIYYDNEIYPSGCISMAEDKHLIIRLAYFSESISMLRRAFLHYRKDNPNSLTFLYSEKSINDLKFFLKDIACFLEKQGVFEQYKTEFYITALQMKYYVLYSGLDDRFWKKSYPEANRLKYLWAGQGGVLNKTMRAVAFSNMKTSFVFLRFIRGVFRRFKGLF